MNAARATVAAISHGFARGFQSACVSVASLMLYLYGTAYLWKSVPPGTAYLFDEVLAPAGCFTIPHFPPSHFRINVQRAALSCGPLRDKSARRTLTPWSHSRKPQRTSR